MQWECVASVTPGGKRYFWTGRHEGRRYWVVWHRDAKAWELKRDTRFLDPREPDTVTLSYHRTAKEAKDSIALLD